MTTMLLIIMVLLLGAVLMSSERKRFEDFFQKNKLPGGNNVNIHKWVGRGLISGAIVLICLSFLGNKDIINAIVYSFITLMAVSWGGPYVEYAVAWNLKRNREK